MAGDLWSFWLERFLCPSEHCDSIGPRVPQFFLFPVLCVYSCLVLAVLCLTRTLSMHQNLLYHLLLQILVLLTASVVTLTRWMGGRSRPTMKEQFKRALRCVGTTRAERYQFREPGSSHFTKCWLAIPEFLGWPLIHLEDTCKQILHHCATMRTTISQFAPYLDLHAMFCNHLKYSRSVRKGIHVSIVLEEAFVACRGNARGLLGSIASSLLFRAPLL